MKFKPTMYLESIYHADFEKIFNKGYRVLFIDLDNTLVPHDVEKPTDDCNRLVEKLQNIGFEIVILSNNSQSRVTKFSTPLKLDFIYSARKPLSTKYKKLINEKNYNRSQILCIGDQIMTDVYGANRQGLSVMLVEPLEKKDIVYTKINRFFEKFVYNKLAKKNILNRGEFYYE